jgi:hypothetical protein
MNLNKLKNSQKILENISIKTKMRLSSEKSNKLNKTLFKLIWLKILKLELNNNFKTITDIKLKKLFINNFSFLYD